MAVVGEGLGLDLDGVGVEPLVQVLGDGDGVAVDVLTAPCLDPCLVAGLFGGVFCGEAADPLGFGDTGFGVGDADDVGPGATALHDPVTQLGPVALGLARRVRGGGVAHQAASSVSISAFT